MPLPAALIPLIKLGIGAGSIIGGWIHNNRQRKKALEEQKQLMALQLQNQQTLNQEQYEKQRLLNEQGAQIQSDMLRQSGPAGQINMLKDAGLNPALLYGKGGMGGMTTGGQGGGSAQGGSAASGSAPAVNFMDIIAASQIQADIKLKEAQANKANADASKTLGWEKENIETSTENLAETNKLISAQINTEEAKATGLKIDNAIKEIQRSIQEATKETSIESINKQLESLKTLNEQQIVNLNMSKMDEAKKEELLEQLVKQNNLNMASTQIQILATKQGIKLDQARITEINTQLEQKWDELEIAKDKNAVTREGYTTQKEMNDKMVNAMITVANTQGLYGLNRMLGEWAGDYLPMPSKGKRGHKPEPTMPKRRK